MVVAIIALLAVVAAPPLARSIASMKVSSASNVMLSGLYLARAEAIKRNSSVVLCRSADGTACAASGSWDQGWIVFDDRNNNSVRDAAEPLLQQQAQLATTVRLSGNGNVERYVSFAATGATRLVGGGLQMGTLTICTRSPSRSEARTIVINAAGRPRVERVTVESCA